MVTLTARQSIILKCTMKASVLLGNYEFYYAAGLFCKITGMEINEDIQPQELYEWIAPKLKDFVSEDEREAYLAKLLFKYRPLEAYDAQMKELLLWGFGEDRIWQMN